MRFTGIPEAVILASALLLQAPAFAQEKQAEEKPQYIGVDGCAKCHKRKSTGNQLGKWQEAKHSKAYATLATPEAKKIAAEKGIADPQKDGKCLKCHVTAHGVDAALIAAPAEGKKGLVQEDGVGCESCHGPGSLYKPRKVMKDREASIAAGMTVPDEKTCEKCHNKESPTFKEFKFEEMWEKIKHPNPKRLEAEAAEKGGG